MKLKSLLPPKLPSGWRPDAKWLTGGLTALGLVAIAWSTAQLLGTLLSWRSSEPALALTAPVAEDGAAMRRTLTRWFDSVVAKPEAPPLAGLQLIAVIAGPRGVALIAGIEPAPMAVQVGNKARSDLMLVEVRPDRAIFDQNGTRMELAFPTKEGVANLISPAGPAGLLRPPPLAEKAPPRPQPLSSVTTASLSRGRLTAIAQGGNLGDWDKGLSAFPSGGIQITSASKQPLAQVLELHDGDIIRQVNDRPLNQLADVSLVYHYFSQAQEVNLQILRNGKPMQITFKITP